MRMKIPEIKEQLRILLPFVLVFVLTAGIWGFAMSNMKLVQFKAIKMLPQHAALLSPVLRETDILLGTALAISAIVFIICLIWIIYSISIIVGPVRRLTREANEMDIDQFLSHLRVRKKDRLAPLTEAIQKKLEQSKKTNKVL